MPEGKPLIVVRVTSRDSRMTRMGQVLVEGEEPQRFGEALGRIRFPGTHAEGHRVALDSGQ